MSHKHSIKISDVIGNVASFETITYKVINETTTSVFVSGNLDNNGEKIIPVPPGVYSVELTDIGTSNCVEIREGIIVDDVCDGFNVDNINVNVPTLETYTVTFTSNDQFILLINDETYDSDFDGFFSFRSSVELGSGDYSWTATRLSDDSIAINTLTVVDASVTVPITFRET